MTLRRLLSSSVLVLLAACGGGEAEPPPKTPIHAAVTADPREGVVGAPISLKATATPASSTYAYAWTIDSAADGSTSKLVDETTAAATFTPDVPGDYKFSLAVKDTS